MARWYTIRSWTGVPKLLASSLIPRNSSQGYLDAPGIWRCHDGFGLVENQIGVAFKKLGATKRIKQSNNPAVPCWNATCFWDGDLVLFSTLRQTNVFSKSRPSLSGEIASLKKVKRNASLKQRHKCMGLFWYRTDSWYLMVPLKTTGSWVFLWHLVNIHTFCETVMANG